MCIKVILINKKILVPSVIKMYFIKMYSGVKFFSYIKNNVSL